MHLNINPHTHTHTFAIFKLEPTRRYILYVDAISWGGDHRFFFKLQMITKIDLGNLKALFLALNKA